MSKRKNIIALVVSLVIVGILSSVGTYYYFNNKKSNNTVKTQNTNIIKNNDNKINGYDISPLTKEQFQQAIELGKKYKNVDNGVMNKYGKSRSMENFKETKGSNFAIYTPYLKVADVSQTITEKYIEPNIDNIMEELKKEKASLKNIYCAAWIGGDSIDFVKNLHIVLRVYSESGKQTVIQPQNIISNDLNGKPTSFFPESPVYYDAIAGAFDSDKILPLKPKYLEMVIIYPDGFEVKEKFEYDKLNK
ncbi:TPA: hypothetical protein ACXDAY_002930 [Clostridium botulinum]|uniref:hypothetical protein n=2 Tax=Clostridium botulinum TaxID=1491 RepID=UPI00035BA7DC|nr:hypothetical protein [Clostridium botulinum]APH24842.1 hypothetical protein NPD1_3290 [Clostridium botulinum]APQ68487.1 hypothetical protein RSJ8_1416 [Clostridium botulinum]EPS56312.1 hypothetical protein CLQ_12473 [Clostridium botulinum Af84]MBN3351845.1 hypothetical protein [Clostridium botulinum]MBN3359454.1 hypothetical protein [Clostridium botulinum]